MPIRLEVFLINLGVAFFEALQVTVSLRVLFFSPPILSLRLDGGEENEKDEKNEQNLTNFHLVRC